MIMREICYLKYWVQINQKLYVSSFRWAYLDKTVIGSGYILIKALKRISNNLKIKENFY